MDDPQQAVVLLLMITALLAALVLSQGAALAGREREVRDLSDRLWRAHALINAMTRPPSPGEDPCRGQYRGETVRTYDVNRR